MTTLTFSDSALTVEVQGLDKILAFRGRLTIPLDHIADVVHDPEVARGWWHGFKVPGSNIPGVVTAGTFYQHNEKVFWDVHNPDNTVVITLHDEGFQKLIIEVADPPAAVTEIQEAIRG